MKNVLRYAAAATLAALTAMPRASAAQPPSQIVPPEIQTIVEVGTTLAGLYSGVTTGLNTMAAIQALLDGVRTPSATEQQFAELNKHLDEIGIDITDLLGNSFQGQRLAYGKTAYQLQRRAVFEQNPVVKRMLLMDADSFSSLAVNFALHESAFQRKLKGKSGLSYDWRVGMPHLLYIIGVRLQVMGALLEADGKQFISSSVFDADLLDLRDGLLQHRARILEGLQMNEHAVWVRDVNTGLEFRRNETNRWATFADMRDAMWTALPLFEVQQVVDVLNLHLSKKKDLTSSGRVVLEIDPNFCLKAATQLVPYSTPNHYVELAGCPRSPSFLSLAGKPDGGAIRIEYTPRFEYNRGTGHLKDVATNTCVTYSGTAIGGGHLHMFPCGDARISAASQTWSWDPINKVLMHAWGEMKVMELIGGGRFAGNQLTVWPMNALGNQRWVPKGPSK